MALYTKSFHWLLLIVSIMLLLLLFFPSLFLFSERLNKLKIIHLLFRKAGCKLKLIFLRLIFSYKFWYNIFHPFFPPDVCLSLFMSFFLSLPFILTAEQGKFSRIKRKFDTEISHLSPALPPHMHSLLHYQQSLPEWYVCPYL